MTFVKNHIETVHQAQYYVARTITIAINYEIITHVYWSVNPEVYPYLKGHKIIRFIHLPHVSVRWDLLQSNHFPKVNLLFTLNDETTQNYISINIKPQL
jgi:hypothetical protein